MLSVTHHGAQLKSTGTHLQVEALLESEATESSAAIQVLQDKLRRAKRKLADRTRIVESLNATVNDLENTVTDLRARHDSTRSAGEVLGHQTSVR